MKWWQFLIFILLFLLCEFGYRFFLFSTSPSSASPLEDPSSEKETRKKEEIKDKELDEKTISYQYLEVDKYFKFDNGKCWINNRSYDLNRNFGSYGRIVLILDDSVIISSAKRNNEYFVVFQKEYLREIEQEKELEKKSFNSAGKIVGGV